MKIKNLQRIDRPREKMEKYGPDKLANHELLAILLRTGTKNQDVLKLSQKVLQMFKEDEFANVTIDKLKDVHGLGIAKSCEIVACFELGRRMLKGKKTSIILTPKDVWERMEHIRGSKKEHFVVFYLDSQNQEIKKEIISIGTLNESLVHPREVFEGAIKNNAASIIVAHNHPSGSLDESVDDIEITKKLVNAGKLLDIKIVDHVIVSDGPGRYRSVINNV